MLSLSDGTFHRGSCAVRQVVDERAQSCRSAASVVSPAQNALRVALPQRALREPGSEILIVSQHTAAVANPETGGNDFYAQTGRKPASAVAGGSRIPAMPSPSHRILRTRSIRFRPCSKQFPRCLSEVGRNVEPSVGIMLGLVTGNQAEDGTTAQYHYESVFHDCTRVPTREFADFWNLLRLIISAPVDSRIRRPFSRPDHHS